MKRFLILVLIAAILSVSALAGGRGASRSGGYVHGYYRSNGTYVEGYYRGGTNLYSTPSLPKTYDYSAPKSSYNYWSAPTVTPRQTYEIGGTKYIYGEHYKNGLPKVERSSSAREQFLRSNGLEKIPDGYEIDHIVPLHRGGADSPENMQLLTKDQHRIKTARERAMDASSSQWRK